MLWETKVPGIVMIKLLNLCLINATVPGGNILIKIRGISNGTFKQVRKVP